ncbi:TetR/AcrR family transcriptional regulator [Phenylobacterium sp.]|uniref:TetR/AcrR family transcriptional regulator n=1 Tax=Phenylobacterium sp. TaxID=1871053 RepID=UPI0030F43224
MSPSRRLPKDQRRAQLLHTAAAIIRSEGTDALTLATLAERAGVTKPIAYGHFGTRAGLLIALYQQYEQRQAEAVGMALQTQARTLDDAARILAAAHVDCVLSSGPEFGAVAAALSGTEEMEGFRQALRQGYAAQYRSALTPFAGSSVRLDKGLFVGLLGAADALSQDAAAGRLSRLQAVDALTRLIVAALGETATT